MSTNITPDQAKKMIEKYRNSAPKDALKCALFNGDFNQFLKENTEKLKITGIRVYLAQDEKGENTVILAATTHEGGKEVDVKTGYYDYATPCPIMCDKGEI